MLKNLYDPVEIVRTCKGAPLAILWLLGVMRKPMQAGWLARHSGYSDKTVTSAIAFLEEKAMLVHVTGKGWMLTEGFQLSLPEFVNSTNSTINNDSESYIDIEDDSLIISGEIVDSTNSENEPSRMELGRLGISINNTTRPLLQLSVEEIRKGEDKARRAGHNETGYLVAVLLGIANTRKYGHTVVRDLSRYAEWNED